MILTIGLGVVGLGTLYLGAMPAAGQAPGVASCKTDLASRLESMDVPGIAAAIVKDGRIVCTAVAGLASIEEKKPVTPNTLFLIASVSKTVTGTALLQLYDQGRFSLDDDINGFLPFRIRIPAAPDAPITFRQILTHTASIKDNLDFINCPGSCAYGSELSPVVTKGADSPISLKDFTKGYLTPDGDFYDEDYNFEQEAPGKIAEYSNIGIVVAGYLVETITGIPFDQYCKEHVFAPLGMTRSSWRLAGIDRTNLAMPYDKTSSGKFVPYGHYGEPDYPDGMLRTSVVELAHFLIAHMQGGVFEGRQILKSGTVEKILSSQTELKRSQGLVWIRRSLENRSVWGHDGSDNGAGADMWFDPDRKTGVIMMTNGVWRHSGTLLEDLFQEADKY